MIKHWLTRSDAPIEQGVIKRFDPDHWTVDFPRGAIASVVRGNDAHSLVVQCEFHREGDLIGLIFESEDRHVHPAHRREHRRDYANCTLQFRWESEGLVPLDAVNGPTLTIEGEDAEGSPRTWYVRLWNYAEGEPTSAEITLDFNAMDAGFSLPADADRVYPHAIDRMFISLASPGFVAASEGRLLGIKQAKLTLGDFRCDGSGSVLSINDAVVPEHGMRICTAYDDAYHLVPERVIVGIERLGYRKIINHYIGMSHFFALGEDGLVDPSRAFNTAAYDWHAAFARAAAAAGYDVVWSVSYELLEMFCPPAWKQRHWEGSPALTGYEPPSTLVSPASEDGIAFLSRVAVELAALAAAAGLPVKVQVGEPWWWIASDRSPCIYDDAARAALSSDQVRLADVDGAKNDAEKDLLDRAGELLATSTGMIADAVRSVFPDAELLLLTYLPGSLAPEAPELRRMNLPTGWSYPAFDVLQLEDYEWVTGGRGMLRKEAVALADQRLGYAPEQQHYLAGFVTASEQVGQWEQIVRAADEARQRGVAETFIWAFPQVVRDGLTLFGDEEDEMQAFDDVLFPLEIGAEASVAPTFSTSVVTSASGYEFRNVNWNQARLRFDAGPGVRSEAEMETLLAFFRARRGSAVGFRFRDPYDFSSCGMTGEPGPIDQTLGTGDGERTAFPLIKSYDAGEARSVTRPIADTVVVSIDGQITGDWTLEPCGIVQFHAPPVPGAIVRAGYLFDVPVRFAEDRLEVVRASFRAGEAPSVPLIEVREYA